MIFNIFFVVLLGLALWCAIKISITDFRTKIIPDAYLFPLMLIGLILTTFFRFPHSTSIAVIGATTGYVMALLIGCLFDYITHKRSATSDIPIGMGDIKLIGVGGIWLGTTGLSWALIIACVLGMIWARHMRVRYIPFAPFFITGSFFAFLANIILL